MASAGILGLGWASCGGESAARLGERCVAVDGIQNVIRMLEEIEDGRLPEADFLELSACTQGCVGAASMWRIPTRPSFASRACSRVCRSPATVSSFMERRGISCGGTRSYSTYLPSCWTRTGRWPSANSCVSRSWSPTCPASTAAPAGALLPGLRGGRGAGPRLGGRLHFQGAGAHALHGGQQGGGGRLPAPALPPPPGAVRIDPTAAVKRPASHGGLFIQQGGVFMTVHELTEALS